MGQFRAVHFQTVVVVVLVLVVVVVMMMMLTTIKTSILGTAHKLRNVLM